jgi:DNA-directed RNA polymerase subunit RPC12/RpoP
MALKFPCTKCGKDIIVKFLKVGEPARCPHCGFENIVPEDAKTTEESRDYAKEHAPVQPTVYAESEGTGRGQETTLGPHTLESVFSGMFSIYGNSFLPMIAIVVIVLAITAIPISILMISTIVPSATSSGHPGAFLWLFLLLMILIWFLSILMQTLEQAVISYLTFDRYFEKPTLKRAWDGIKSKFWRIFGANLLAGLAVMGLALTIIGIPFAIYYGNCWRFITQAIIVEDCGAKESLMRSKELVTDHWWRLFGIMLAIVLCFLIIYLIASFVPLVNVIARIVLMPLPMIANTLLYLDMRVRKDAYNEESLKKDLRLVPVEVG